MTDADASSHTLVFIGGLHRSGTTLLAQCLADHPQVSGFHDTGVFEDEGQFLQSVYPIARKFGGPGRFGFAPEMHLTESSPLVSDTNRGKLFAEWVRYWDSERAVLVEKSPPNLLKSRFLQAMFPHARFIMVLRHPIANAVATQKMSRTPWRRLIEHWFTCYELLAADVASLEHVTIVRYEDFVLDANEELTRLHRFIGVEETPHEVVPKRGSNENYFKRWREGSDLLSRSSPERYLPRSVRRWSMERSFEGRARAFGYSLRDPLTMIERDELLERLIPDVRQLGERRT